VHWLCVAGSVARKLPAVWLCPAERTRLRSAGEHKLPGSAEAGKHLLSAEWLKSEGLLKLLFFKK